MEKCGTCGPNPCGCADQALITQPPCEQGTPLCPDSNPCAETFDSQCIIYNGIDIECTGLIAGMTVQQALLQINNFVASFACLSCPTAYLPITPSANQSLTPTLTWAPVPQAISYDVLVGITSPPATLFSAAQVGTSFTFPTALAEDTTYYWQIVPNGPAGSKIDCSVQSFTTLLTPVLLCDSPITYFINTALTGTVIANAGRVITDLLDGGLILNSCNLCCPDCDGTYILSSTVPFQAFIPLFTPTVACCMNSELTVANYLIINEALTPWQFQPTACCNDFGVCITELTSSVDNYSTLLTAGIIEYGTINDNTGLCLLLDAIKTIYPSATATQLGLLIESILTAGLVIACENGKIFMGSVAAYTVWKFQPA